MNNKPILDIQKHEIEKAATVLLDAFKDDPLMHWVFGTKVNYLKSAKPMLMTWVKFCVLYGWAWRTKNFEAVSLRKKPGHHEANLWQQLRSGMFLNRWLIDKDSYTRLSHLEKISKSIRLETMPDSHFIFCWLSGTSTAYQSKGFASKLMNYTFERAKKLNLNCYLEVTSKRSEQIHVEHGYEILKKFTLPDSDIKVTAMLKKP